MDQIFSDRISDVPRSFIREILKVALDPAVISFAGGLPNRDLFPVEPLKAATAKVFDTRGRDVLQYGTSEGFPPLREYIAERYREKQNLDIPVENILITSGSQQGLDLLGKIILNKGDGLVIEVPGYLGAIQAFSIYQPRFLPVPVSETGMDPARLKAALAGNSAKLMYTVPNFQNPSGITYPADNRQAVAELVQSTNTLLIEDDPYGDLRFSGQREPSFKELLPEQTVLLGSFSKSIVPGFRLGWLVAPEHILQKLVIAKQATDLHTSHFTQSIIRQYLQDNDSDRHLETIISVYGSQCRAMRDSIKSYFPPGISYTRPQGGMFLWVRLPGNLSSLDLFETAVADKVIFVPGDPFYINKTHTPTLRLNFSCVDEPTIHTGIQRLADAINRHLEKI
ncbi:MAG: PLP-dependent aminotransferase family protein [Thermodesulfobacteriota bacterium]|nr:PLP-dependent aminotransferase family protein [Thermodesulfobacteriota bacterium]